jgi:hypothetical protein
VAPAPTLVHATNSTLYRHRVPCAIRAPTLFRREQLVAGQRLDGLSRIHEAPKVRLVASMTLAARPAIARAGSGTNYELVPKPTPIGPDLP